MHAFVFLWDYRQRKNKKGIIIMYKEKIRNLMHAVKDDPDDLEFVESRMNAFTSYVSHVAWMETRIQRLTIEGVDGEAWRDAVESLDSSRRSKHNVAMDAINQLNRLSAVSGLPPFYDGPIDDEHRNEVGDVIGSIVNEYFEGRYVGQLKVSDLMDTADFTEAIEALSGTAGKAL